MKSHYECGWAASAPDSAAMRHIILEEPYSRAAVWSRRLAGFSIAVMLISILLARSQIVDAGAALAVFGAAIVVALAALLAALAGAAVIWSKGWKGTGLVLAGVALAALVLAEPAWLTAQAVRLPTLNDVSTDLNDPPDFSRSRQAIAARGNFDHPPISPETREAQRAAYTNIQPIVLDLEIEDAWPLVQKAVAARKWRVVEEVRPGGRVAVGHIDAIARTLVMGFADDVAIRVRPLAAQTRIDVRSASRLGRHDFGANAKRIQTFSDELQAQLDAR